MHFDTSISLATGVSRRCGGGTLEAERRTRSALAELGGPGVDRDVGKRMETSFVLPHATGAGDGLDIDQERLVLRRLDVGVADEGRQRVRAEALLRLRP